jgi:flagellar protein FliL
MAEKKEEEKKKKLDLGLILQVGFFVLNLAGVGTGAYLVYASTIGWQSPQITEEKLAQEAEGQEDADSSEPLYYTMDKFTVNLAGEPKRTIRIEVNLEMLNKDGFEEVMTSDSRAIARDKVVSLLSEKTFSDVESIQGKLYLKSEIASLINGSLDKGVVRDVHFSEFVVQ